MFKISIESIKSLQAKPTDDGMKQEIKGTVVFNVPLSEAGVLNGKEAYIVTEDELNGSPVDNQELRDKLDGMASLILKIASLIDKRNEVIDTTEVA